MNKINFITSKLSPGSRAIIPAGLLFIIPIVITFYSIVFYRYSMKWDFTNSSFPFRFFTGECIKNFILPVWNPYQGLGYSPIGDPPEGSWYPVPWIMGLLGGYNFYLGELEYLFHVWIAGIGMFLLTGFFVKDKKIRFIAGLSYMLSGFFIGNAQHLGFIISAAWIPWIFNVYFSIKKNPTLLKAAGLSVLLYLLLSGGYPFFLIIMGYLLLILFIYEIIKRIYHSDTAFLKKFISVNFISVVLFILLGSPVFISVINNLDYIKRFHSFDDIQSALDGSFSPQSLLSVFYPIASAKTSSFWMSDISLTNVFFGSLNLVFLVFFIYKVRFKRYKWLWISALIFLGISFGHFTPLGKWFTQYVPLISLSRFPAILRLFFIICLLLISAYSLELFEMEKDIRFFKNTVLTLILFFLFSGLYFLFQINLFHFLNVIHANSLYAIISNLDLYESFFFQTCTNLLFLLAVLFFLFIFSKKRSKNSILFMMGFEIILNAFMNQPLTVVCEVNPAKIQQFIDTAPEKFPVPSLSKKMLEITDIPYSFSPMNHNLNIYRKQPARDIYGLFYYETYSNFLASSLYPGILMNPIGYLSDKVEKLELEKIQKEIVIKNPCTVYLSENDFNRMSPKNYSVTKNDSFTIKTFIPGKVSVNLKVNDVMFFTLLQNYHHSWKVYIDGKLSPILKSNISFMTVEIKPENKKLDFVFEPAYLKLTLIIAICAWTFILTLTGFRILFGLKF